MRGALGSRRPRQLLEASGLQGTCGRGARDVPPPSSGCRLLGIHSAQLKVIIIVLMFISTLVAAGFETQFYRQVWP